MPLDDKTLKLCNCNQTMALDARGLAAALKLKQPVEIHTELCRKEVASFHGALKDEACVVACTQEAPLFSELADQAGSTSEIKFVNIREHAGWSKEGAQATRKIAALLALADLPEAEPVAGVSYKSGGELLIVGPAEAAIFWAEKLAEQLDVNVLLTPGRGGELPAERRYPVWSGKVQSVKGHLGAFEVAWQQDNAIDLEVCTRCNACIHACPEQAIDFSYQIDMDKCKSHRECVKACGAIGAIDFERADRERTERFDMVLDLSREALVRTPQPPQGRVPLAAQRGREPRAHREARAARDGLARAYYPARSPSSRFGRHRRSARGAHLRGEPGARARDAERSRRVWRGAQEADGFRGDHRQRSRL